MHSMKTLIFLISLSLITSLLPVALSGADQRVNKPPGAKDTSGEQTPVYTPMPPPGKKVPLGGGYYLIYGFDKKPKLGTVIMKIELFAGGGKKDTSFEVKADAGMPSMRGAHETGDRPFALSKKGDYLLPVNIVMPGDWEIRVTVMKSGKVFFRGRYNFDV